MEPGIACDAAPAPKPAAADEPEELSAWRPRRPVQVDMKGVPVAPVAADDPDSVRSIGDLVSSRRPCELIVTDIASRETSRRGPVSRDDNDPEPLAPSRGGRSGEHRDRLPVRRPRQNPGSQGRTCSEKLTS